MAGEQKYADAERLLIDGYQGLVDRKATIPSDTGNPLERARERIFQLYQAWGKPERAGEWSARVSVN